MQQHQHQQQQQQQQQPQSQQSQHFWGFEEGFNALLSSLLDLSFCIFPPTESGQNNEDMASNVTSLGTGTIPEVHTFSPSFQQVIVDTPALDRSSRSGGGSGSFSARRRMSTGTISIGSGGGSGPFSVSNEGNNQKNLGTFTPSFQKVVVDRPLLDRSRQTKSSKSLRGGNWFQRVTSSKRLKPGSTLASPARSEVSPPGGKDKQNTTKKGEEKEKEEMAPPPVGIHKSCLSTLPILDRACTYELLPTTVTIPPSRKNKTPVEERVIQIIPHCNRSSKGNVFKGEKSRCLGYLKKQIVNDEDAVEGQGEGAKQDIDATTQIGGPWVSTKKQLDKLSYEKVQWSIFNTHHQEVATLEHRSQEHNNSSFRRGPRNGNNIPRSPQSRSPSPRAGRRERRSRASSDLSPVERARQASQNRNSPNTPNKKLKTLSDGSTRNMQSPTWSSAALPPSLNLRLYGTAPIFPNQDSKRRRTWYGPSYIFPWAKIKEEMTPVSPNTNNIVAASAAWILSPTRKRKYLKKYSMAVPMQAVPPEFLLNLPSGADAPTETHNTTTNDPPAATSTQVPMEVSVRSDSSTENTSTGTSSKPTKFWRSGANGSLSKQQTKQVPANIHRVVSEEEENNDEVAAPKQPPRNSNSSSNAGSVLAEKSYRNTFTRNNSAGFPPRKKSPSRKEVDGTVRRTKSIDGGREVSPAPRNRGRSPRQRRSKLARALSESTIWTLGDSSNTTPSTVSHSPRPGKSRSEPVVFELIDPRQLQRVSSSSKVKSKHSQTASSGNGSGKVKRISSLPNFLRLPFATANSTNDKQTNPNKASAPVLTDEEGTGGDSKLPHKPNNQQQKQQEGSAAVAPSSDRHALYVSCRGKTCATLVAVHPSGDEDDSDGIDQSTRVPPPLVACSDASDNNMKPEDSLNNETERSDGSSSVDETLPSYLLTVEAFVDPLFMIAFLVGTTNVVPLLQ